MNETPKVVGFPNTEEEHARLLKQDVERYRTIIGRLGIRR